MTPAFGLRLKRAQRNASITNAFVILLAIDQPTIMRVYKSITTARYNQPSRVGMYVISAVQTGSGAWVEPQVPEVRRHR